MNRAIEGVTPGGWKAWTTILLAALLAGVIAATLASPADSRTRARISVSPTVVDPGASVSTTGHGLPRAAKGSITDGFESPDPASLPADAGMGFFYTSS